ncbi:MAG: hypothetical protein ACJ8F1_21385 [Polyangia bacterium]
MDAENVQFLRMKVTSIAGAASPAPTTAAELFGLLWRSLSDLLGSATTATLLRRSKNAVVRRLPAAGELVIDREGLEYRYTLPPSWSQPAGDGMEVICAVVDELRPLLMELTGATILDRLDQVPGFRDNGIVFSR